MSKWLTIIGMGEDGLEGLNPAAGAALSQAEIIIGSKRLLGFVPSGMAAQHEWPQPFAKALDKLTPFKGRRTVILATGDPSNYGVARKILERIPFDQVTIIPHLSAFSLAAARLGWSLPDCDTLTLHGRATSHLEPFIQPGVKLLVLTADGSTVTDICQRLTARGFGTSEINVLENLGGAREAWLTFTASMGPPRDISPLNIVGIICRAGPAAHIFSRVPGLADHAFQHDGQLTKAEVRAATLAALQPAPDQLLWDVGAGCGSVAIEWMRCCRGAMAIAIEPQETRRDLIAINKENLGTPRLVIVPAAAPEAYVGLPEPDAIFIGGGITQDGVFAAAWKQLKSGGRMVANTVTVEGDGVLYTLQKSYGGELLRIDIAHLHNIGPYRALKPRMAVTQWRATKS